MSDQEPVKVALERATRGLRVYPRRADSQKAHIKDQYNQASTDGQQIRQWWEKWPDAVVSIATGTGSDLVVIDVDLPLGEITLANLQAKHGPLPHTLAVKTPSGGRHLYFRHPGGYVKSTASQVGPDVDVRGDGGQVVAYDLGDDQEPAELPRAWAVLLQSEKPQDRLQAPPGAGDGPTTVYGASALESEAERVAQTPKGERNKQLNNAGLRMGQLAAQGDVNLVEAQQKLTAAADAAGMDEQEDGISRTLKSSLTAGLEKPRQSGDLRNAIDRRKRETLARKLAHEELDDEASIGLPLASPMGIEEFLARERLLVDELIPGILRKHERLGITAFEGTGKTTFSYQLTFQGALGIHPFTGEQITPFRSSVLDLENPGAWVDQTLGVLKRAAIEVVGKDDYSKMIDARRFHVDSYPFGIDVNTRHGVKFLEQHLDIARPELWYVGPLYKMADGDINTESEIKPFIRVMEKLREKYGFALILEMHCPQATVGFARPRRPIGSSIWLRWFEFGKFLDRSGAIDDWRTDRMIRSWPGLLKRGGNIWPWESIESDVDQTFTRILQLARSIAGERKSKLVPSSRAIEAASMRDGLKVVSKSTVDRLTKDSRYLARWKSFCAEVERS